MTGHPSLSSAASSLLLISALPSHPCLPLLPILISHLCSSLLACPNHSRPSSPPNIAHPLSVFTPPPPSSLPSALSSLRQGCPGCLSGSDTSEVRHTEDFPCVRPGPTLSPQHLRTSGCTSPRDECCTQVTQELRGGAFMDKDSSTLHPDLSSHMRRQPGALSVPGTPQQCWGEVPQSDVPMLESVPCQPTAAQPCDLTERQSQPYPPQRDTHSHSNSHTITHSHLQSHTLKLIITHT